MFFFVFVFFFSGAFLVVMTGEREKVRSRSVFRLVVFLEFLQRLSIDFAPGFDERLLPFFARPDGEVHNRRFLWIFRV